MANTNHRLPTDRRLVLKETSSRTGPLPLTKKSNLLVDVKVKEVDGGELLYDWIKRLNYLGLPWIIRQEEENSFMRWRIYTNMEKFNEGRDTNSTTTKGDSKDE